MNNNEIKEKINSNEYDFLRIDKHLGKNIILLTTGGSHAYGTNIEGSDLDIRGIALENREDILGLSSFEQFTNKETDTTIYGLKKLFSLILNTNPNTIELLGTKNEQVYICNKYGSMIKDNVDLFLSQRAKNSFGGYATAQLRRLQNALARDNYPQPEKEKHILDSIKGQMTTFEDRYKIVTNDNFKLYVGESDKEDYDSEIFIDINLQNYPLRDLKNMWSEMNGVVDSYAKLNGRNSKKDNISLNKHSMHLIRLFLMGTEIMEGKGVNTFRENDHDLLMGIRNGDYLTTNKDGTLNYSYIFELVDEMEKKFKYACDNSPLPKNPNYKKVEELLMDIYGGWLNEN
jgi:predicted nucleotidyltransferase